MAARVSPDDYGQLHHFVCASCWPPEPLERVLVEKAEQLVDGPEAVLIVDVAAQAFYGPNSPNSATHIRRPHTAPNGEGTALSVMLTGLPGLATVRRHLEALGGGSAAAALLDPAVNGAR